MDDPGGGRYSFAVAKGACEGRVPPRKPIRGMEDWPPKEIGGKRAETLAWDTIEGIVVKRSIPSRSRRARPPGAIARLRSRDLSGRERRCTPTGRDDPPIMPGYRPPRTSTNSNRANLKAGQMGLSCAFDLATIVAMRKRPQRVVGESGKAGVALDLGRGTLKILFDAHPVDKMSVLEDDEGRKCAGARRLHRRRPRRRAYRPPRQALGDHPERHLKGVHGPTAPNHTPP